MNIALNFKLIVRNWWRNKIHFFISLLSLTIGLTCTNLLITFFIHEYNVESSNPNRENIYILRQDSPMEEGEKVTFTNGRVVSQIKNSYAEIASMLRIGVNRVSKYEYQGNELPRPLALEVDSTLTDFFPYEVVEGSLHEVLTTPGKVALSADYARQIFGAQSGMGEIIETQDGQKNRKSYQVAAILRERAQSFLKFDLLMGTQDNFVGGAALLKLPTGTNIQALQQKIRDDKRTREIAIRQIHGASMKNILWLLNRPFVMQIFMAYVIAIPLGGIGMQPWLEQFTIRTGYSFGQFLWPLIIISLVSCLTVSIHTFLVARNNPTQSLKTE